MYRILRIVFLFSFGIFELEKSLKNSLRKYKIHVIFDIAPTHNEKV